MNKVELQSCTLVESHVSPTFRGKSRTIKIYKRESDGTFWWSNFGPEDHVEIVEVELVTNGDMTTYQQKP